jgi:CheY-like chemotaxis protein
VSVNSQNCGRKTILVVEDEPTIRLMISDALRDSGFEVIEVATADEAVIVLGSSTPLDAVFTDYRLPGSMNGVELLEWLRRNRPGLKCAVGSAYTPPWPSPDFADLFIGKPYDVPRTVSRLKSLVKTKPS